MKAMMAIGTLLSGNYSSLYKSMDGLISIVLSQTITPSATVLYTIQYGKF